MKKPLKESVNVNPLRTAFKVALAKRDMSQAQFARNEGVTPQALSSFLKGRDASHRLSTAVTYFIKQSER